LASFLSDNNENKYHFEKISDDNNYIGFGDFDNVPDKTYLHLLGNYKRNAGVCRKMETYTMKYYPKYYSNLMTLLGEKDSVSKNSKNLISRDLFYEGMPILFDRLIKFKLPFYLKKMTEVDLKESDEYIKTVEFDGKHEIYKTDEIDFMILNELKTHILYNNFISKIKLYLEDDTEKIKNAFLVLINNRLRNYISLKIITISFRER